MWYTCGVELAVALTTDANNPDVGDLYLDESGDAVLLTSLADEVATRLATRFNFFRGEWFLDQRLGTPYFESILVKGPRDSILRSVLSQVITGCSGVATLDSLDLSVSSDGHLSVVFACTCADGSVFSSADYPPFLVLYARQN